MTRGAPLAFRRLVAVAGLICALAARADDLAELRQAIDRGDWPAAEAALRTMEGQPAVDRLELFFLSGMMWAERGDLTRAAAAFLRVVDARPDLPRPRLELARVYFRQGDDAAARQQFERVLAAEVPAAVVDNVRPFLDAISQRNAWTVDFMLAPVSDDNLNGGTTRDTVDLGGLTFNINPDAKAVRGDGLITSLRAKKLAAAGGPWRHELTASLLSKAYNKNSYDDLYARLGYGLRRVVGADRAGEGVDVGSGFLVTERRIGDAPFSRSRGLRLDARWPLDRAWSVDGVAERQWVSYHDNAWRDGPTTWLAVGAQAAFDAATVAQINFDHLREQAGDAGFRLSSRGVGVAVARDFPWALTVGLNARQAVTSYDEPAVLFSRRRRDTDRSLGIVLAKKDWRWFDLHPSLSVSREWRTSSIDFFSSRRNRFLLAFERRF